MLAATLNTMDILLIVGIAVVVVHPLIATRFPVIALSTCPLIIAVMVCLGAMNDDGGEIAAGIFFAGILLFLTMLGVLASKSAPESPRWPKALAKFSLVLFAALAALVILGLLSAVLLLPVILLLIAGVLVIRYLLIARDDTTATLFTTIAAGIRQNLPLSITLAAESAAHTGKRGAILASLSQHLAEGDRVSEAIRQSYPACPGYAVAMVAGAERMGQLPRALGCIEEHLAAKARRTRRFQTANPIYGVVVVAVVTIMLGFLMVFVLPKFQKVFAGMGSRLPAATRWLIVASRERPWLVVGTLWFMIVVIVPSVLYTRFRPRRADNPRLLSRWGDFWKWHLPFLHWFEKNCALHQTVSFLRLGLRVGQTVDQAIEGASMLDLNGCYRRRLGDWLQRVREGENVSAAARASGTGAALAWAFDTEVNPGNAPAVLESLESFYRAGYSYAANLVRLILWPCATLVLAAIVGVIVYAFFAPLPALVEAMLDTMVP